MSPHPSLPAVPTPLDLASALDAAQTQMLASDGHTLVIAGPGSGKTHVLIAKASKYINAYGPSAVAMVTFSKASTQEMRDRLATLVGAKLAEQVSISTFHAHCLAMLKAYWRSQRIPEPRLLDDPQAQELIKLAARELNLSDQFRDLADYASAIGRYKAGAGDETGKHVGLGAAQLEKLANAYARLLKSRNAMDFGDLIPNASTLIGAGKMQPLQVKHLLVDEFQDVDGSQLDWLDKHRLAGVTLHMVGDDDQAIYGFRASLGFKAMKSAEAWGATKVFMSTNYRCDQHIIGAAECALRPIRDRFQKDIQAHSQDDGVIEVIAASSLEVEAHSVLTRYHELVEENPTAVLAVLARTNEQLQTFEKNVTDLIADGAAYAPIRRFGGKALIENPVVQRRLALFKAAVLPSDMNSFIFAVSAIRLSSGGHRIVHDYLAESKGKHPLDVLFERQLLDALEKDDKKMLRDTRDEYVKIFEAYENLDNDPIEPADKNVCLNQWITESSQALDKLEPKVLSLHRIGTSMLLSKRGAILDRLTVLQHKTNDIDIKSPGIICMTAHGSKGLEFSNVWIFGCSKDKFPLQDSDKELSVSQMDEERRLFYVACTRAKNSLTISHTGTAGLFVREVKSAAT